MVFNSIDALKNHILSRSQVAVEKAVNRVHYIINLFLTEYYNEYDPIVYERTEQLLKSLVRSDVTFTANGCEAEVYFDLSALNYSTKLVNGIEVPNKGWSEEKTLHEAMVGGTHGGYVAPKNTRIWDESMVVLKSDVYGILKDMLISAGIPIK